MDFQLSQEQEALQSSVKRFCQREYSFEGRRGLIEKPTDSASAHWRTFAELGWLGAGLAEDVGGFGGGPLENALILEQFGNALVVEPLIAHLVALHSLTDLAPTEQSQLIDALITGSRRVVLAHFEPVSRGHCPSIESIAELRGDHFQLSGHKAMVLGAAHADSFLISARDGDGTSLFLVDANTPGVEREVYRTLDNHVVADLRFDSLTLDKTRLVGRREAALASIELAIDHGIIYLCAEALGAMEAAMLMTRDYLKTRQQFGTTLNNFQALQHRMADMLIETELSRSMLYQGLAALNSPDTQLRKAGVSATKVQFCQSGLLVGTQSIQLHGGIGVTEEYAVGHYYKRLFVISRLYGDADYHRDRFIGLS